MDYKSLAQAAIKARDYAYAPYSRFRVGAALLGGGGEVYTGCNIESAAYSPTNCAERTAVFKAVSEGEREFVAIAVVGGFHLESEVQYCYPCGVCRQVLAEFVRDDFEIIVVKSEDDYEVHSFGELLPYSFGADNLR